MSETKPTRKGKKRALNLRYKLFITLFLVCLATLMLVWTCLDRLLQPQYNAFIHEKLENKLEVMASQFDQAAEDGTVISQRDMFGLTLNPDFWAGLNESISNGQVNLSESCVDISDQTLRCINQVENLHPCLIHEGGGIKFGQGSTSTWDTSTAIALRQYAFENGSLYKILETESGTQQMVVGRTAADGQYAILVSASLARVGEADAVLGKLLPMVALGLLAFCLLAAWLLSRWITRPLAQLSAAARQIAQGNYDVHVDESQGDEFGLLARDFNHMAGEVKQTAQLQRELLANVSHDLRTPLTLIRGYAETVRDLTGDEPDKRTEQLNIIVDETDRLSGLVNSVMELSKVSSGAEKPELVDFDMAQLCEEVAERYDAVCAQNGWTLKLETEESCPVRADPAMMERVLHNLLGNAMHHIGEDGVFLLRAIPLKEGGCRVEIEDHGPGIRPEDLPNIFDRYYRSRSDAGKVGTGLGLSITKAILQGHGFRFGVNSTLGKGTVFWFQALGPARGGEAKPPEEKA